MLLLTEIRRISLAPSLDLVLMSNLSLETFLKVRLLIRHHIRQVITKLELIPPLHCRIKPLFIHFEYLQSLILDISIATMDLLSSHLVQSFISDQLKTFLQVP